VHNTSKSCWPPLLLTTAPAGTVLEKAAGALAANEGRRRIGVRRVVGVIKDSNRRRAMSSGARRYGRAAPNPRVNYGYYAQDPSACTLRPRTATLRYALGRRQYWPKRGDFDGTDRGGSCSARRRRWRAGGAQMCEMAYGAARGSQEVNCMHNLARISRVIQHRPGPYLFAAHDLLQMRRRSGRATLPSRMRHPIQAVVTAHTSLPHTTTHSCKTPRTDQMRNKPCGQLSNAGVQSP